MKLPNGFGSVHKLSGKRRNPFRARKTCGWKYVDKVTGEEVEITENTDLSTVKSVQLYVTVGYYKTKAEALQALADYNNDPYDLHHDTITFAEVYDKWSDVHFPKVSDSNVKGYKAAFNTCKPIHDMVFQTIKLDHLQKVIDDSGKNTPTLKKIKIMFGLMYDYAVMHEIVSADKREMVRFVDINQAGNPNAYDRKPFTHEQVDVLWKVHESNIYYTIVLMLIYSGVRIGEMLDLKKEDVNLEERWFYIRKSKTDAGIREVPICEKIVPFFEHWMQSECDYLVNADGLHFTHRNYYDSYWKPLLNELNMSEFTPHCTRHTCISFLTEAGVDERIIRKIVGHKGQGVTETVYTHLELPIKLEAINKI